MKSSRARLVLAALAAATLLAAPAARANGRIPEANQLVFSPDDANLMVLRVTFGLLVTHDAGKTWDWVCESAAGYGRNQNEDPAVALLAKGNLALATVEGLLGSPDTGCSWTSFDERIFIDDATSPDDPSVAVALTNSYKSTDDAGVPSYDSVVMRTQNAGGSWAPSGVALDPTLVLDTIDLARGDPQRIYVSGKTFGAPTQAFLLVSTDGGQSYTPRTIPLAAGEHGAYIAAVDPNVEDCVYVRTLGDGDAGPTSSVSRLLVTDDAGKTWNERWSGGKMLGFALSPDGSRVWLGGPSDGLQSASTSDFAFTKRADFAVQCLTASATTLYACSNEASAGFVLGASTDGGDTFTPMLTLAGIHGPIACSDGTPGAQCAKEWPAQAASLGITIDAGASQDGGTVPPPPSDSGCGCSVGDRRTSALSLGAGLLVVLGLWWRRRVAR